MNDNVMDMNDTIISFQYFTNIIVYFLYSMIKVSSILTNHKMYLVFFK